MAMYLNFSWGINRNWNHCFSLSLYCLRIGGGEGRLREATVASNVFRCKGNMAGKANESLKNFTSMEFPYFLLLLLITKGMVVSKVYAFRIDNDVCVCKCPLWKEKGEGGKKGKSTSRQADVHGRPLIEPFCLRHWEGDGRLGRASSATPRPTLKPPFNLFLFFFFNIYFYIYTP